MMKWLCFVFALTNLCGLLSADSLWDENFQGYIAGSSAFRVGDIVTIVIDSSLSLDYSAAGKDSKSITLEYSGGEFGGLFSFLPQVRTGDDRSLSGREKYALKTELAAGITQIDASGKLVVSGTRSVTFEGKQESVTITGRVDPKVIDSSRKVGFSDIENARLSFSSFLTPPTNLIAAEDLEQITSEAAAAEGAAAQTTVVLSDQKKRELLLLYLNRLIDIIFR